MPASLSAFLLTVLLAGFWMVGRRRSRPFLRSTDMLAVAALNRAQIERLREPIAAVSPVVAPSSPDIPVGSSESVDDVCLDPLPTRHSPLQRRRLLNQLALWSRGSCEQRRQAMRLAGRWGDRAVLPLLRRGLRDPDPAVMAAAAAGIDRFRGRTTAEQVPTIGEKRQPLRPRGGRDQVVAGIPATSLRPDRMLRTR